MKIGGCAIQAMSGKFLQVHFWNSSIGKRPSFSKPFFSYHFNSQIFFPKDIKWKRRKRNIKIPIYTGSFFNINLVWKASNLGMNRINLIMVFLLSKRWKNSKHKQTIFYQISLPSLPYRHETHSKVLELLSPFELWDWQFDWCSEL